MKIGFIGLGTMGLPMANNLLKKGYELIVYNRTKEKMQSLVDKGAMTAASPKEAAEKSEIVFTIVTADQAVEEVMLGKDGIIAGAHPGLIVVDSSTISPATSKRMAQALAERGVEMLDAPVAGSEPHAIEGTLTFMVGGKEEIFEKCRDVFLAMGKNAYYMGESGNGSYMKLANNLMSAVNLLVFSEAVTMAAKAGIDPEVFVKVVSGGGARNAAVDGKAEKFSAAILRRNL